MTYDEARDEMFAMLKIAWDAGAGAIVSGAVPSILWQGQEYGPPALTAAYARATVHHNTGRQTSLTGEGGQRRFTRYGIVFIQIFVPVSFKNPLTIASKLGKVALDAYEGRSSPGGIWFRNARLNEIGPADGWEQVNVVAEFQYDEVK